MKKIIVMSGLLLSLNCYAWDHYKIPFVKRLMPYDTLYIDVPKASPPVSCGVSGPYGTTLLPIDINFQSINMYRRLRDTPDGDQEITNVNKSIGFQKDNPQPLIWEQPMYIKVDYYYDHPVGGYVYVACDFVR